MRLLDEKRKTVHAIMDGKEMDLQEFSVQGDLMVPMLLKGGGS